MAASFTRETLALDARTRPWQPKGARWLLWPAWRWRVHTPQQVERPLDVFSRAALGMCAAGVTQPDQIARHLHLPTELWVEVLRSLRQQRYVGRSNRVTEHGIQLLERSRTVDTTTVVGYVFRDPYSGDLWPRVRVAPDHADAEYSGGWPYVRLGFGTIGESEVRSSRALCVLPAPGRQLPAIEPPSPEEIIRAAAYDRQAIGMEDADWDEAEPEDGFASDDDGDVPIQPSGQPLPVDRVQLITDAEPVLLVTCVYLPKHPIDASDWHAMDPFDRGPSPRLRLLVERECEHNDRLRALLDKFTEPLRSDARDSLIVGNAQSRREATEKVDARVPAALRDDSRLRTYLIDMQQAMLEASVLEDARRSKWNTVLIEAGKALERVFATLLEQHPPSPAAVKIAKRHAQGFRALTELRDRSAHAVGLQLPSGLLGTYKVDGLANVLTGAPNGSLRDLLLAVLVAAGDSAHADHPLRAVARDDPGFYERIDHIAGRRNVPAHDTDRRLTQADAEAAVAMVYSVMRTCFDPDDITTSGG